MTQSANLETGKRPKGHRKFIVIASVVTLAWLMISGVVGPLFGSLSTVQKNDNSKFLPDGSESSRASLAINTFAAKDAFKQFPTLVLFIGKATPDKVASANVFAQSLASKDLVDKNGQPIKDSSGKSISIPISNYLASGAQSVAFPSAKGDAILANIPLSSDSAGADLPNKKPVLPAIVTTIQWQGVLASC